MEIADSVIVNNKGKMPFVVSQKAVEGETTLFYWASVFFMTPPVRFFGCISGSAYVRFYLHLSSFVGFFKEEVPLISYDIMVAICLV